MEGLILLMRACSVRIEEWLRRRCRGLDRAAAWVLTPSASTPPVLTGIASGLIIFGKLGMP